MIKRLNLLAVCALVGSGQTQAMHKGEYTPSLFSTTADAEELEGELCKACDEGSLEKVTVLLDAGALVCIKNKSGQTPLHIASGGGA